MSPDAGLEAPPTLSSAVSRWIHCLRVAHHRKSVFSGLSRSRLERIHSAIRSTPSSIRRRCCATVDGGPYVEVCGVRVPPTGTVRDLGILLEADMQMTCHVKQLVSRCFCKLRLIKSCIRSLPFQAAKTAVACFVITQVDRCNSLLVGAPKCLLDRLQSVLNSAARLVCNRRKYYHMTPLLRDRLHWLPVQYRIDYKQVSSWCCAGLSKIILRWGVDIESGSTSAN